MIKYGNLELAMVEIYRLWLYINQEYSQKLLH